MTHAANNPPPAEETPARVVSGGGFGSCVCDRWGGEDSLACNEDGSPAIVEGDEIIVRDYWEDEYGSHLVTERHSIDGERFYWASPNKADSTTCT